MKKKILLLLVALFLIGSTSMADTIMKEIRVALPQISFYFDGVKDFAHSVGTYFNGKKEVPLAFNFEGTTYVPLRYIGEKLGKEVGYDPRSGSIWIGEKPKSIVQVPPAPTKAGAMTNGNVQVYIGEGDKAVSSILGTPDRKEFAALKYDWWVYNRDLKQYVQVGIQNGKVVDLYSNAPAWNLNGIKVGTEKSVADQKFPGREVQFTYGGANFTLANDDPGRRVDVKDGVATILYFDLHNGNRVTAIRQMTVDHLLQSKLFSYAYRYSGKEPSVNPPTLTTKEQETVNLGNERIILDLANVARARFGVPSVSWNEEAAKVARAHSQDMLQNHYFSHESATTGLTPFDRLDRAGISFSWAGENIAKGYYDGIEAHEGWMNSKGHRENLLKREFTTLGVGVKGEYYSQEFVTP